MRHATRLPSPEPITPGRIEQALVLLASIVVQDGTDVYLPILERLEAELIETRRIGTPSSGPSVCCRHTRAAPSSLLLDF